MDKLQQIYHILQKDLHLELRRKEIIITMVLFALITIVIFHFADKSDLIIKRLAAGIFWVTIIFTSNLGLQKSFAREQENNTIQALQLCASATVIYIAKFMGNFLYLIIFELIFIPIFAILFNITIPILLLKLASVIVLTNIGLAAAGTLLAAISAHLRSRDMLLPIILLPIIIPLLLAAVSCTEIIINETIPEKLNSWLKVLSGFALIYVILGSILYEFVIQD